MYRDIESLRGKPLIVYVTSQRQGAPGGMAGDVINEIIDQVEALPEGITSVDLFIESTGGDALTAWRMISLLRSKAETISALIPHSAFSAATMLALGCDEIVMGRYGSLGPIDPQITVRQKDGSFQQFAYEDIVAFLDFAKKQAGLTEQEHIKEVFKLLSDAVDPSTLGFASRASSLSVSIGERLLQMHMKDPEQKAKATTIATQLNKSFFSHGHALSRQEAQKIGLNIVEPSEQLEKLLWDIHKSFEEETTARKPFNPISEFLADPGAQPYLQSPPPLHIPPQVDPQTALQMISNYINQQLTTTTPNIIKEIKYAFVESIRCASEFYLKMKILVSRTIDLKFIGNAVQLEGGWRKVPIPTDTDATPSTEDMDARLSQGNESAS